MMKSMVSIQVPNGYLKMPADTARAFSVSICFWINPIGVRYKGHHQQLHHRWPHKHRHDAVGFAV